MSRNEKRQLKRLAQIRMGIQDAYADTELISAVVELEFVNAPEFVIQSIEQTFAGREEYRHAGKKFGRLAWRSYERTCDTIDYYSGDTNKEPVQWQRS